MANVKISDMTAKAAALAVNDEFEISEAGTTTKSVTGQNIIDGVESSVFPQLAASTGTSLVGHIDGTVGAVATTVQSRLRLMPNNAGGFWPDSSSPVGVIQRQYDRVFIGGAVDADGTLANTVKDWLETERAYTTRNSQFACTSTIGQGAVLGGSRTSDSLDAGSEGCIGVVGFTSNNNSTQVQSSYAGYFESRKKTGAGITHGIEIDIVNEGSVVSVSPTSVGSAGLTNGLWVASGGGVGGAATSSVAIGIINNGAAFEKGIVFQSTALSSDEAISFGLNHTQSWYDAGGNLRAKLRGDATADSMVIAFENSALSVKTLAETNVALVASGQFTLPQANHAIEIGASGSSNTPFIDFHSGATGTDYDSRIIASGGSGTTGGGTLELAATQIALSVGGSGEVKWGRPLVALGGGAAPTLGTIGGSGPASAGQNAWMRVLDSTGAAFFVPAWK